MDTMSLSTTHNRDMESPGNCLCRCYHSTFICINPDHCFKGIAAMLNKFFVKTLNVYILLVNGCCLVILCTSSFSFFLTSFIDGTSIIDHDTQMTSCQRTPLEDPRNWPTSLCYIIIVLT